MEKLSPKEIRFIENYLKNSGVFFFDVRLEMTDHVASELEERLSKMNSRGFYEEFKDYMRLHKKSLLKSTRKYQWQADKKVLRQVFFNMLKPKVLLVSAAFMGLHAWLDPDAVTPGLFIFFGLTIMGVWLVPYLLLGKKNFLSLNRLALLFFAFIYFGNWGLGNGDLLGMNNIWINSVVVLINNAVIKSTYDLVRFYKKEYQVS